MKRMLFIMLWICFLFLQLRCLPTADSSADAIGDPFFIAFDLENNTIGIPVGQQSTLPFSYTPEDEGKNYIIKGIKIKPHSKPEAGGENNSKVKSIAHQFGITQDAYHHKTISDLSPLVITPASSVSAGDYILSMTVGQLGTSKLDQTATATIMVTRPDGKVTLDDLCISVGQQGTIPLTYAPEGEGWMIKSIKIKPKEEKSSPERSIAHQFGIRQDAYQDKTISDLATLAITPASSVSAGDYILSMTVGQPGTSKLDQTATATITVTRPDGKVTLDDLCISVGQQGTISLTYAPEGEGWMIKSIKIKPKEEKSSPGRSIAHQFGIKKDAYQDKTVADLATLAITPASSVSAGDYILSMTVGQPGTSKLDQTETCTITIQD